MDIAVTDPKAPLGWVFGTFMYNGLGVKSDVSLPRVTQVTFGIT